MLTREQVQKLVYAALEELNEQLPAEARAARSPDTVLFGKDGALDSLGLVELIVAVERNVFDLAGVSIVLANEKAMSMAKSPFRTVTSLVDYVEHLLGETAA